MHEIQLTPEKLKEAIDLGKLINSGLYSRVFTYGNRLIKLDQELYDLLKDEDIYLSKFAIYERYKSQKEDFNSREQIRDLIIKQPFIRPRVPEGIITLKSDDSKINEISPGIILYPFINYTQMKHTPLDCKRLLIILKIIFNDIKNLADNGIAHEDLHTENILIQGYDAQIIDMSGSNIKVGKDFSNANIMYECFAKIIDFYNDTYGFERIPLEKNITENDLSLMITEFEKQTKSK